MKKFMIVLLMAGLVCGMSTFALAQQQDEKSTEFITVLASELKALLDADNVLGTPIEYGGTKIIPVISYGFGFGGGSGTGNAEGEQGAGTGAGSGGGVMPVSFLVIKADGEIQVITARKGEFGEIMKAVAPMLLEAVKIRQQAAPKEAPPAEQE